LDGGGGDGGGGDGGGSGGGGSDDSGCGRPLLYILIVPRRR